MYRIVNSYFQEPDYDTTITIDNNNIDQIIHDIQNYFSPKHLFNIIIDSSVSNLEQFEELLKISVYKSDPNKSRIKSIKIIYNNHINVFINKLLNVELDYANLTHLYLSGNANLTDQSIIAIANSKYMKNLTALDLSCIDNLTDQSIMAIANSPYMKNLTHLNLSWNRTITDQSISYIKNKYPKIRINR